MNRTEEIVWAALLRCFRSDHPDTMARVRIDWLVLDAAVDVILAARRN